MVVFTFIILGLIVMRGVMPFTKDETYKVASSFIASALVLASYIAVFVFLFNHFFVAK